MAGNSSNSGDIFDFRKIRRLVELMNEHGLSEVELRHGERRIRLGRATLAPPSAAPVAAPTAPAAASQVPKSPAASEAPPEDEGLDVVVSPMVGTFYASSSPDAPAFVKVGDHVEADTTVCIVEAMKVFNEIPAGVSGTIVQMLGENGAPVEYGQPLFKIDTSK